MVEEANGEPIVIYEIFKLLNCMPKNRDDRFEYDTTLIIVLNNQLFIKQKRKKQVDVFFNHLFNHLTEEGHFLFFIETESSKERISLLKKKVEELLFIYQSYVWCRCVHEQFAEDIDYLWHGAIFRVIYANDDFSCELSSYT